MMSAAVDSNKAVTASSSSRCASCGIAEDDDVKLRKCTACYLVKYCGIECQKDHRKQHKRACKKRAAELRDEILFKQPESSHLGDCPICMLPMPLDMKKSTLFECCSKAICNGCSHANTMRENEMRIKGTCPFCRESLPSSDEEGVKLRMKRIEANDPDAIRFEGVNQCSKGNYASAFDYFTMAAKLGDAQAHYKLAGMYHEGQGVEMDKGKEIHHLEKAAIGGHPNARFNLGNYEWVHENYERAVKHWIISAAQGDDSAMKNLMMAFKQGAVGKEDLDAALRAHQAAIQATKSPQREAAAAAGI